MIKINKEFIAGKTYIPVSGAIREDSDFVYLMKAVMDGVWTEGRFSEEFKQKIKNYLNVQQVSLTNSGSSANLVAINSMLDISEKENPVVLTCACGFPTTAAPIIQSGAQVVWVDIDPFTLQPDYSQIGDYIDKYVDHLGGAIFAHTLGFPYDAERIANDLEYSDSYLIEDCCDAFGAKIRDRNVGTFGSMGTLSFYPAHIITTGEGGAVFTHSPLFAKIIQSYIEWGRGCSCPPGVDNTCGKRFEQKIDGLPEGYDHKYIYERVGYNLKMTDFQAALGASQITHIEDYIKIRQENFEFLKQNTENLTYRFTTVNQVFLQVKPVPFGFPIIMQEDSWEETRKFRDYLERNKIATRPIFAGNLLRHPAFKDRGVNSKMEFPGADYVMRNGFWIGCYPGITTQMREYMLDTIQRYWREKE